MTPDIPDIPERRPRLSKAVLALVAGLAGSGAIATQFIYEQEGQALTAYQDGARVWTICRGHTQGVQRGQTATTAQCRAFLTTDLNRDFDALDTMVHVPIPPTTRAALASWMYNVGIGAAEHSRLIAKLNAGDRMGACDELRRWVVSGGHDCRNPASNCRGIVIRRERERALCRLSSP